MHYFEKPYRACEIGLINITYTNVSIETNTIKFITDGVFMVVLH